jgi:hypothetical protein
LGPQIQPNGYGRRHCDDWHQDDRLQAFVRFKTEACEAREARDAAKLRRETARAEAAETKAALLKERLSQEREASAALDSTYKTSTTEVQS